MTRERAELLILATALPERAVAAVSKTIIWICPGLAKLLAENPSTIEGVRRGEIPLFDGDDVEPEYSGNVVSLFKRGRP